jgi:hypothetical protein
MRVFHVIVRKRKERLNALTETANISQEAGEDEHATTPI